MGGRRREDFEGLDMLFCGENYEKRFGGRLDAVVALFVVGFLGALCAGSG